MTLKSQGSRFINVVDFGATPDSGDDATPAFQAAIDAAGVRRREIIPEKVATVAGCIVIPPGEFVLRSPLHLRNGVSLAGASVGSTTLLHMGEGPCMNLTGRDEKFNTSVSNIAFVGNPKSGAAYDAVHANRGVTIRNCFFTGFETAARLYDCYTPAICDCVIWNNRVDGIQILDGHNVTLFNNRIENAGRHGIYCTYTPTNTGTAITMYGNVCQGNRCAGYYFEGVSQFYMGGNFAEGNNRGGGEWGAVHIAKMDGASHISHTINGMYITSGFTTADGSAAIVVDGVPHISLRDVVIRSNGKFATGIALGADVGVAMIDNCVFLGVPDPIVPSSSRTTVHVTPARSYRKPSGEVFQGPGYVSDGEQDGLETFQLNVGQHRAGWVGLGTFDGRPALQAYGRASNHTLHLNPQSGAVAIGVAEPTARLDVDGSARFRGGDVLLDGDWSNGRLRFRDHYIWVDQSGQLRVKHGAPAADDDGMRLSLVDGSNVFGSGRDASRSDGYQLVAGAEDAGRVAIGSLEGQPAIQGSGTGTSHHLRLNPEAGNVAVGNIKPTAKLDVDGSGRIRGDLFLDGGRLRFGEFLLWVDADGVLRIEPRSSKASEASPRRLFRRTLRALRSRVLRR